MTTDTYTELEHVVHAKKLLNGVVAAIRGEEEFEEIFPLERDNYYKKVHRQFLREVGVEEPIDLPSERDIDPTFISYFGASALQRTVEISETGSASAIYRIVASPLAEIA